MAIDSREKRAAVAHIHSTGWHPPSPTTNASKDVEWRQEAGWGYPGITPSEGGDASLFLRNHIVRWRRRGNR